MAIKAIIATLVLGSSSLALAAPREARVEHRIHEERRELRADRRNEHRIEGRREERNERRFEGRRFERERRFEHVQQPRRGRGRR